MTKSEIDREFVIQELASEVSPLSIAVIFTHWKKSTNYALLEPAFGGTLEEWMSRNFPKGLAHVDDGFLAQLIFSQLVLALKRIHRVGIVHADYKPANLMINNAICKNMATARCARQDKPCTPSQKWIDNRCAVKLMDYGLACIDRAANGKMPRLHGCVRRQAGTPAFMDADAHHGELTRPSFDVWALGTTLHWLLFNAHLFVDGTGRLNKGSIETTPALVNCWWPAVPQITNAASVCRSTLWRDGIAGKRATTEELWNNFAYLSEEARSHALRVESMEHGAIGHGQNYQPPAVITDAVMPWSTWIRERALPGLHSVVTNPFGQ